VARIAAEGLAVRRDDVADQAAGQAVGEDAEGRRIGNRDHVRLLDRVEAGDRRAVEAHPVVERALDLTRGDREALQMPLDVREPQQDELHRFLLQPLQNALARLLARRRPVLRLDLRHGRSLLENTKSPEPRGTRARGSIASHRRAESTLLPYSGRQRRPWANVRRGSAST